MCPNCKRENIFFHKGFWRTILDDGSLSSKLRACSCGFVLPSIWKDEGIPKISKSVKKNIGVYLRYQRSSECIDTYGSDRIRGEWVIPHLKEAELYNSKNTYNTIIFHSKDWEALNKHKGLKVADICDPEWTQDVTVLEFYDKCDIITVSTQGLKDELSKLIDRPIYVIGDGHNFDDYPKAKVHKGKAKEVVWFGFSQNAHSLSPFIRTIKENNIKLKIVSQDKDGYAVKLADSFIKWNGRTAYEEITKADFALLPNNGSFKSNNKTITAKLCCLPVAKTEADFIRFLDGKEREKEVKSYKLDDYDVKNRAEEYQTIIDDFKKDFTFYTAICGGFDDERNDIKIFDNSEQDLFVDDVMNAKRYKVLSHQFIKGDSVWLDGNIYPLDKKAIIDLLGDYDMAVFAHPHRKTVYEEHAPARQRLPEHMKSLMDEQIEHYKEQGFDGGKLAECGMIIRKDNLVCKEFNNKWWSEICRYQWRDQISFPYVAWKLRNKIKIRYIEGNVRTNPLFKYVNH